MSYLNPTKLGFMFSLKVTFGSFSPNLKNSQISLELILKFLTLKATLILDLICLFQHYTEQAGEGKVITVYQHELYLLRSAVIILS